MERFKLWLLSLFIKDLASVLRQLHKLVDRLAPLWVPAVIALVVFLVIFMMVAFRS